MVRASKLSLPNKKWYNDLKNRMELNYVGEDRRDEEYHQFFVSEREWVLKGMRRGGNYGGIWRRIGVIGMNLAEWTMEYSGESLLSD